MGWWTRSVGTVWPGSPFATGDGVLVGFVNVACQKEPRCQTSGPTATPLTQSTSRSCKPGGSPLIAAIRTIHRGLIEARLVRLEDVTFFDSWRWDSAEHMQAAPVLEAGPTWSLTRDATSDDGEIMDER